MDEKNSWANLRGIIRRRKKIFFLSAAPVFLGAVAIAFLLPAIYVARTTILVEGQQIPQEYVRATITSYVDERLQVITQQILSSSKLLEIIKRFDLYRDLKDRHTTDEILQKMRKAIKLDTISADVVDRRSGQPNAATIAFSVSYEGESPATVQNVANVLASLYLEENAKTRGKQASNTTEFLQQELQNMKRQVEDLGSRISEFKKAHVGQLPEYTVMNLQIADRARNGLDQLTSQITAAQERKLYLESQLALVEPTLPGPTLSGASGAVETEPRMRLKALRLQLNALRARLSDAHPDVARLTREIATLEAQVGRPDDSEEKRQRLKELRAELDALRAKLGPEHPDVLTRTREAAALSSDLDLAEAGTLPPEAEKERGNPAYVTLKAQIGSAELEIANLTKEKSKLLERADEYDRKLAQAPAVEREYMALTRDYENNQIKYKELMNKLMEARVAQGMEERQKGERFTIIDAARLPEKPYKPDRPAIVLIGLVLSLGIGVGLAAATEGLDVSIKTADDVTALATLPVLATLPLLQPRAQGRVLSAGRVAVIVVPLVLLAAALAAVHLYVAPLDVLWPKIERKLFLLLTA